MKTIKGDYLAGTEEAHLQVWSCEQDYLPGKHYYLGRDAQNVPRCHCGGRYNLPPEPKQATVSEVPVGAIFRDVNGQVFTKLSERRNNRGQLRHEVRCESSPFTKKVGPISSAFFCRPGDVIYLTSDRPVVREEAA